MIRNKDIIAHLSAKTLATLQQPLLTTPQEVISVHGGKDDSEISRKPIYTPQSHAPLCYFETRTRAVTAEAETAINELDAVLHRVKQRVFLEANDFISIANNHVLWLSNHPRLWGMGVF